MHIDNKNFDNSKFSNKLDEMFVKKIYEFKNKLIIANPKLNFYLNFGNSTVQIYYKYEQKKDILCYVDIINGNITKTSNKNGSDIILSNINNTELFQFNISCS